MLENVDSWNQELSFFMKNLLRKIQDVSRNKKLIVFDLDNVLTKSKSDLDDGMAQLFKRLLEQKRVAIIGGADYNQMKHQFLVPLHAPRELLKNLFLLPTNGASFYRHVGKAWKRLYIHSLSGNQKKRIFEVFKKVFAGLNYKHPKKIYGRLIEDRGTQITFAALGQHAPLRLKEKWRKKNAGMWRKIAATVQKYLPDLEVRTAGLTSIDVTQKGIDKEYGIKQIKKHLGIPISDMLFVGDDLFPGGNNYPALRTGVQCFEVKGVEDTKKLIKHLLQ